jgi:hypothetical protein
LGKTGHGFEDIAINERFVGGGVTEEREKAKFSEGGTGDGGNVDAYRLRGGKGCAKVIIDDVDGGEVGMGGNNRVEEGIDGGKGGCVGPYVVFYVYLVSTYRPSYSPLSQSIYFVPLFFHHSLKVGGGLGGANDWEEALKGDQELDELLFVRKCPLLAMRPASGGGKS